MKKMRVLLLLGMILVFLTGNAFALPDSGKEFIKLEGIKGESVHPGHDGWIELISFSHHGSREDTGDPSDGRSVIEEFSFKHLVDRTTPGIQQACMTGTVIPGCIFESGREYDRGYQKIYEITMEDVRVTSAKVEAEETGGGGFRLVENVVISAKNAHWKFFDPEVPPTGDNAPLLLWVLLLAGSGAAIFLLRKRDPRQ